jgi:hypothetical protein
MHSQPHHWQHPDGKSLRRLISAGGPGVFLELLKQRADRDPGMCQPLVHELVKVVLGLR